MLSELRPRVPQLLLRPGGRHPNGSRGKRSVCTFHTKTVDRLQDCRGAFIWPHPSSPLPPPPSDPDHCRRGRRRRHRRRHTTRPAPAGSYRPAAARTPGETPPTVCTRPRCSTVLAHRPSPSPSLLPLSSLLALVLGLFIRPLPPCHTRARARLRCHSCAETSTAAQPRMPHRPRLSGGARVAAYSQVLG